jgi:hypothetical protein
MEGSFNNAYFISSVVSLAKKELQKLQRSLMKHSKITCG